MSTTHITSGYDIEILLGEDFFLRLVQTAYDAESIPHELDIGDGRILCINRPKKVTIQSELPGIFFEITLEIKLFDDWYDQWVQVRLIPEATSVRLEYVDTSAPLDLSATEALRESLRQSFSYDQLPPVIREMALRSVHFNDGFCNAIALYLNLDLQLAPKNENPSTEWIPRGNAEAGQSFLPRGKDFAIGSGADVYERLARHLWHKLGVENDDGIISHPLLDQGEKIGTFKDLTFYPYNHNAVRAKLSGHYPIDNWPDAEFTATLEAKSWTNEVQNLEFACDLIDLDLDTGYLADFLSGLIGGVVGGVSGLLCGGLFGAGVGAGVGIATGVGAYEIGEQIAEEVYGSSPGEITQVNQMLSNLPLRYPLFETQVDPFHKRYDVLFCRLLQFVAEPDGVMIAGQAVIEHYNSPTPIRITDCVWTGGSPSELEAIVYECESAEGSHTVSLTEVKMRRKHHQLAMAKLTPTHIYSEDSVVRCIRFSSGLELPVYEAVRLQNDGILTLPAFQLIQPENGSPYYRAKADNSVENNFESLPAFVPSIPGFVV